MSAPNSGGATHGPTIRAESRAHDGHADQCPTLLTIAELGELGLQARWQLQLIEAEHGQRQPDEHQREGGQDPGILEHRLEIGTEQSGQYANDGISQGHRQHIDQ
jgi:hypothetical protein